MGLKCPFLVGSSNWRRGFEKKELNLKDRNILCSGVASAWISRISYRLVDMVVVQCHVPVLGPGLPSSRSVPNVMYSSSILCVP